jgi:putative membrane protein
VPVILNYVIHLALASGLIALFLWVYTAITPFNEFLLIRQGNNAAALSLAGSLIGFSLTIASSLIHTADYQQFTGWAFGAMLVQVLAYGVTTMILRNSKDQIESGNTAYGGLLGAISLSIGAVNAACIS